MRGDSGRDSLPLLPAGMPLFDALPSDAVVLAALARAVGEGMIAVRNDEPSSGVMVIHGGTVTDAVHVAGDRLARGGPAIAAIQAMSPATVSATTLTVDAVAAVTLLLRGEDCYDDLRIEWTSWDGLLADLRERGTTYAVELTTPAGRGVTVLRDGHQVTTYTDAHPHPGEASVLDDLATAGRGVIRVLRAPAQDSAQDSARDPAEDRAAIALRGLPARVEVAGDPPPPSAVAAPVVTTFAAMFGAERLGSPAGAGCAQGQAEPAVGDVLDDLRLLVHSRLQRSSGAVDQLLERAADDRRSVNWVAGQVRAMSIRGFIPASMERLADDMVSLATRRAG